MKDEKDVCIALDSLPLVSKKQSLKRKLSFQVRYDITKYHKFLALKILIKKVTSFGKFSSSLKNYSTCHHVRLVEPIFDRIHVECQCTPAAQHFFLLTWKKNLRISGTSLVFASPQSNLKGVGNGLNFINF